MILAVWQCGSVARCRLDEHDLMDNYHTSEL